MDNKKIRVIIADAQPIFRLGIQSAIAIADNSMQVVGEVSTNSELISILYSIEADISLMNVKETDETAPDIIQHIKGEYPKMKILIFCEDVVSSDKIEAYKAAGVSGIVSRSVPEYELRTAIKYTVEGGEYFSSLISNEVVEPPMPRLLRKRHQSIFTSREEEIILYCCEGETAQEIADELKISLKTVVTHKYNIFKKLNIHSTNELVRYCIRNGLVNP